MGFPWFKFYGAAIDHPKVIDLCAILGQPLADAYVARLWAWCNRFRDNGRFVNGARSARDQVETAVRWSGPSGALADAMLRVGLLDEPQPGILDVHDWEDHQAAHIRKSETDAERKRAVRTTRLAAVRAPGAQPSALPAPKRRADGAGKTETETETEKMLLKDPASASPDAPLHETESAQEAQPAVPASPAALTLAILPEGQESADRPPVVAKRTPGVPDPRHAPLVKRLVEIAQETDPGWKFDGGRDAKQVSRLLTRGEPSEVESRWRRARSHAGFPAVRELSELVKFWGHFPEAGPSPPASDPRKGFVRADEQDWSSDGGYGDLNEQAKQAKKAREGR